MKKWIEFSDKYLDKIMFWITVIFAIFVIWSIVTIEFSFEIHQYDDPPKKPTHRITEMEERVEAQALQIRKLNRYILITNNVLVQVTDWVNELENDFKGNHKDDQPIVNRNPIACDGCHEVGR